MEPTVDLEEIRDSLTRVTWYGNYLTSLCPFHEDNNPSFFVNAEWYHCLSCRAYGSTKFLMEQLGSGFSYPVEMNYSARNPFPGWEKTYGSLLETFKQAYSVSKRYPLQMEYVLNRGISADVLKRSKVGWMDGWITFPAFSEHGKLIGGTARLIRGNVRYMIPSGQNRSLLYVPDWSLIKENYHIYLVFGIVDALTLVEAGIPAITTMTGITGDPEPFSIFPKKVIHVIPDRGEEKTASTLVSRLDWRGKLKLLDFPEGCKDCNDVWMKDKELLEKLIKPERISAHEVIKSLGF